MHAQSVRYQTPSTTLLFLRLFPSPLLVSVHRLTLLKSICQHILNLGQDILSPSIQSLCVTWPRTDHAFINSFTTLIDALSTTAVTLTQFWTTHRICSSSPTITSSEMLSNGVIAGIMVSVATLVVGIGMYIICRITVPVEVDADGMFERGPSQFARVSTRSSQQVAGANEAGSELRSTSHSQPGPQVGPQPERNCTQGIEHVV